MSIASEISRLQTAKANLKTAIEGKGVTVPSATTLDGYAQLVGSISGGGGSGDLYENYAAAVSFKNVDFLTAGIENVSITSKKSNGIDLKDVFNGCAVKTIEVTAKKITNIEYFSYWSGSAETAANGLTKITIHTDSGYFPEGNTFMRGAFQSRRRLKTIDGGAIDASQSTNNTNMFYYCEDLEDVRFKNGTIKADTNLAQSSKLTNDSLLSIANGLDGSVTGKTLTLHATPKATCATIMGTNNSGTFEADAQGTISLANFITTVKGWTLA